MTTLIYQDEKSHKFWTIVQKQQELHLSWGRVGTQGQSQIKSFDDDEQARKACEKLIKEKSRKGYLAAGEDKQQSIASAGSAASVQAVPPAAVAPASPKKTPSAAPTADEPLTASPVAARLSAVVNPAAPLWLTEDDAITLPQKLSVLALSHRDRPLPAIGKVEEPAEQLRRLKVLSQETKKNGGMILDGSRCDSSWQQAFAIAQACLAEAKPLPQDSPMAAAALMKINQTYAGRDTSLLIDAIVASYGLEYAVEMIIASLQIGLDRDYRSRNISFYPADNPPAGYQQNIVDYEMRLRWHLSAAQPDLWQRCADRLVAALPLIPLWRQPLVSLLLPERPELADEITLRAGRNRDLTALEWLKMTATDEDTLHVLEYYQALELFDSWYYGEILTSTVLLEQGVRALPRLAPYAHGDRCGEVLMHVNHPQALMMLIDAAGKGKRSYERAAKASKRFPHAAFAALVRLLNGKEDALWRSQLHALLHTQPQLAAEVAPWLSAEERALVESSLAQLNVKTDCASAEMLPAILVSPPWTVKKQVGTIPQLTLSVQPVAPQFDGVPEDQLSMWSNHRKLKVEGLKTEEILARFGFNSWNQSLPDTAVQAYDEDNYSQLIADWATNHSHYASDWNLTILPGLPREKGLNLWNALSTEHHTGIALVMAHFGLDGLPGFINSVGRQPQEALPVALCVGSTDLAPLVSRAFSKLKTLRAEARNWLLKYPEHAVAGLLPVAFGKAGEAQDHARLALRLLLDNGYQELLEAVAGRYAQPEVLAAVNALVQLDPLDDFPAKRPALPDFWQPVLWTRPLLHNGKALPEDALMHLGTMLRFPTENGLYPGLVQVKEACTPDSLAAFAWDLYTAWMAASAPSKEGWAFSTLGLFGNDDIARQLTPLIRSWPGESQHKRAVAGLDILADIGSDIALMQLNGIAQKLKFKALQERAREKISQIAEKRELSVAELEDRLAPDLGLDDNGSLLLDFGPRQFSVSFDESLKPFVRDSSGSRLKDLPKPNKNDDAALATDAVNRFKLLKKDARTIASQQIARLESAMCLRRRWTEAQFIQFLVGHPLVGHLTRRLVWGAYDADNQLLSCFRVAEDNSYSTADDDLFTLPHNAVEIGIPHILEMPPEDAAAFGQLFADYELLPPFRQLDRNRYLLTAEEREATDLQRWQGRLCSSGRLAGLTSKGWLRGVPQDAGWICWMLKPLGDLTLVLEMGEGLGVGMAPDEFNKEQSLASIWLWHGDAHQYGWGQQHPQKHPFSQLHPITASEMLSDIDALFD
ncbi:MolR family transcriptional regulator [Erwinia rhapontici]|uniref:MolR family transcriptional regulator n=1 Tax=Erwinia rhapontici TaxID=55212 RepID=A0ABN6DKU0_ERWRD|nr:WGR and DUF4132 domain-containing protein [Erwinia rhapontici]BCQ35246.1 MolR family transcriptional regulator [Erwinia rhapontici]